MESAGLRGRDREDSSRGDTVAASTKADAITPTNVADPPVPRYTIDLSLPPVDRYKHMAVDFKFHAQEMPILFDDVARECAPNISVDKLKKLSRFALRKVQNKEENEELRGIAEVIGVDMWMMVCYNVLLDMFMGCTSGGVRVNHKGAKSRMLHYRTLDWGMDPLRKIVVHLDFVQWSGGEVIASSLTYFGFVGVLTGVRKGLSMSLNFRPTHNYDGYWSNVRFYSHMVLVLLGVRPSISSILRHCLLPYNTTSPFPNLDARSLKDIERTLPATTTSAAYLILCDGDRTISMEKDNCTAKSRSSKDFLATTNHDMMYEKLQHSVPDTKLEASKMMTNAGMKEIVEESVSRRCVMVENWERSITTSENTFSLSSAERQVLTKKQITEWVNEYPITNEETHFSTIMDPKAGKVVWLKRYLEPLEYESDYETLLEEGP